MDPDDESVTCTFEAHKEEPGTWHGNNTADWQLDTDSWTCNHTVRSELIDAEADEQFCVFHTDPADIPEEIDEAEAFVEVINEQSSSGNEADAKEKKEFVGATFGAFEIERGTTIDAGDGYPICLNHALFQNGISAEGVIFRHEILASSTQFSDDGGVSFDHAEFTGDGGVSFDHAEFTGDGGVSFGDVKFSGVGGVSFDYAKFSGVGGVSFDNTRFSGDISVSFTGTVFTTDGCVSFFNAEFSGDNRVFFEHAKFNGSGRILFRDAEFTGDGGVSFDHAVFNNDDGISFFGTKFSGDESVSFFGVEFNGGVSFGDVKFSGDGGVMFVNAKFSSGVTFDNAAFSSVVDIKRESFDCPNNISFKRADFTESRLKIESMADMNLKRADFSGLNLSGMDFSNARLELALFSRSVLYDSNFTGAEIDGASFGNAQVNELTKFVSIEPDSAERETIFYDPEHLQRIDTPLTRLKSAISRYLPRRPVWSHDPRGSPPAKPKNTHVDQGRNTDGEKDPADSGVEDGVETGSSDTYETSDEGENWKAEYLQKAARTYHTIEKVGRENSLPDLQTVGFVRRQEMHRYRYAEQASISSDRALDYWGKWLRASVARLTLLYGESPWRVISAAFSVILTAALLYPLGGFRRAGGDVVQAESLTEYISILPDSLYFSTLTFTTLGFGDFQPYTWGRWLAITETALGATLIALLVFVLGRRAAR